MVNEPKNEYYVIAVNSDNTYPLERTSHIKDGKSHPEVQDGYLTTGAVTPDGVITPYVPPAPPQIQYIHEMTWGQVAQMTWQQAVDDYLW